jgi:predicted KAP-like P-loop ATPase
MALILRSQGMYYSDRPITALDEDLLGRASFALPLARAIDQLAVAKDGFVIALEGPWGSGKTSIIELLIRYLRYIEMERASQRPIADDLAAAPQTITQLDAMSKVFDTIAPRLEALDRGGANLTYWERINRINQFRRWFDDDAKATAADRYWRLKCEIEARPRTLIVRFSPWMIAGRAELASALLGELARALGDRLGSDVKQAFGQLLQRLAELAPLAGSAFELAAGAGISRLFSAGGTWADRLAKTMTTGPTLEALRDKLRGALLQLSGQQVLVIVDDLDRLTPTEALRMVSVVKSLGDLPNVIYLLSYDETKLAASIEKKSKVNGREFLEKIVQYQVALPPIQDDELFELLRVDLTRLIGDVSDQDRNRIDVAWTYVFRQYFRTPRDVRRFVNSIAMALPALGEQLDPIDVLLVEAVRLSDPTVYNWIRRNLSELTS